MKNLLLKSLSLAMGVALSVATMAEEPDGSFPSCTENCGYERGPNPSLRYLDADRGPYNVRDFNVSTFVLGFGGGTVHYPTNTTGTMGVIAVVPGYLSFESSIEWWGPRLASHGFVVITIDTNTIYDQPNSRADQLEAALDYVIDESDSAFSPISGMVDPERRGVIGWSMGGGGSLKLSSDDRSIRAAIPQAPWYLGFNDFDEIVTPTFIIACEVDVVAPVIQHASPFYYDLPNSTPKAFLEINNGTHFCANSNYPNEDILGRMGVAWMKRFIDYDVRYQPYICDVNYEADFSVSDFRDNCSNF